jgi:hypothetical protein
MSRSTNQLPAVLINWIKGEYGLEKMATQYHLLSTASASWKSDKHTLKKKDRVYFSPGAKGLIGWSEVNPVAPANVATTGHAEVYFEMRNFYEWTLTGDLDNAYIITK